MAQHTFTTGAKRKLLPKELLYRLHRLNNLGVPLTRLLADTNLDMSRPSVQKLLDAYSLAHQSDLPEQTAKTILNSLFPEWLDDTKQQPQTQPDGWRYRGRFPLGEWLNEGIH